MSWRSLFRFFKRWFALAFLVAPLIILYFVDTTYGVDSYDKYKDLVELLSWLFAGIMSLVTFSTLFLAFTYENKLVVSSKNLKSIMKPYSLDTDNLRNSIIEYSYSMSEDKILKAVFRGFIVVSFFSLLTWGTAVGFYTNFHFSLQLNFSIGSLLFFGIYSFYILLFLALFLLAIAIKLMLLSKDPLGKGYLPNQKQVSDFDYLANGGADIAEIFYRNPITLHFHRNPESAIFESDIAFELPINIANLRVVIKMQDEKRKNIATFYGKTKEELEEDEIAGFYSEVLKEKITEKVYRLLETQEVISILKIYDKDYDLKAQYELKRDTESESHYKFSVKQKIHFNQSTKKDFDGNLLKSCRGNGIEIQMEISE